MYRGVSISHRIELSTLKSIIQQVPEALKINWFLENIEGSGNLEILNTTMSQLNKETKIGELGKKVDLTFLFSVFGLLESLDSLLIIGGNINNQVLDFREYSKVYENVEYVFEFFDSTEWNITSLNHHFIEKVSNILNKNEINYISIGAE